MNLNGRGAGDDYLFIGDCSVPFVLTQKGQKDQFLGPV